MNSAPFIEVFLIRETPLPLNDFIQSFSYKKSYKEDNVLELQIKDSFSLLLADRISINDKIRFRFGYLGESRSDFEVCKVNDIDVKYFPSPRLMIRCTDFGNDLKENQSNKIWKGKTLYDIANEVANNYNLTFIGDKTRIKYESEPQSNKTDMQFLTELARRENLVVYVDSETMYLQKLDLDKAPSLKIKYKDSNLYDATFQKENTSTKLASNKVIATSFNPESKKTTAVASSNESTSLGSQVIVNAMGEIKSLKDKVFGDVSDKAERVVGANKTRSELDNIANEKNTQGKLNKITCNLKIRLNPFIKEKDIILLDGFAQLHNGNYLVESISHTIDNGKAVSTLSLKRNATNLRKSEYEDALKRNQKKTQANENELADKKRLVIVNSEGNIQ